MSCHDLGSAARKMQQLHCCSCAAVVCEWLWKGSAERAMEWFSNNEYCSPDCPFGFIFFISCSKDEWDDNKGEWLNYIFESWVVSAHRGGRNKDQGGKKNVEKWELKVAAWVVIKTRISFGNRELHFWRWEGKKSKQLAWGWKGTEAGMFWLQNTVHCSLDLF